MFILYSFILWFAMVCVAVGNGFFGDLVLAKRIGPYPAHLYKTVVIITVIFIVAAKYMAYLSRALPEGDIYAMALATGFLWLGCSIIFEFIFGHYVFGFPWEKLFADYRIWEGRFWSLVLASEIAAPLLGAYLARG